MKRIVLQFAVFVVGLAALSFYAPKIRAAFGIQEYVTVVLKKEDAKRLADKCSCCSPEVRGAFKTALGLPSQTTREEDEQTLKDIKSGKADYGDPRQPLKSKPDGPDERPDEP